MAAEWNDMEASPEDLINTETKEIFDISWLIAAVYTARSVQEE